MKNFIGLLLFALSLFLLPCPPALAQDSTAIEAVSDTTEDFSEDENVVVEEDSTANWQQSFPWNLPPNAGMWDFLKAFFSDMGGFWSSFTWVSVLLLIGLLLILLSPLALLILIVFLIIRDNQKPRQRSSAAHVASSEVHETAVTNPKNRQDTAIKHIALGLGLMVAGYFLSIDLLTGIGIILLCYGGGELFIERRKNK